MRGRLSGLPVSGCTGSPTRAFGQYAVVEACFADAAIAFKWQFPTASETPFSEFHPDEPVAFHLCSFHLPQLAII
jgi:hypothetical protein